MTENEEEDRLLPYIIGDIVYNKTNIDSSISIYYEFITYLQNYDEFICQMLIDAALVFKEQGLTYPQYLAFYQYLDEKGQKARQERLNIENSDQLGEVDLDSLFNELNLDL